MLKLCGFHLSNYHNKVRLALLEKGVPFEEDATCSPSQKDEWLARSPLGKVPILELEGGRRIAVEVQSFLNRSSVRDLEEAVGQFGVYRAVLAEVEPDRVLYLAVPQRAYAALFLEPFGQLIVARLGLRLLVFDEQLEKVVQWIN